MNALIFLIVGLGCFAAGLGLMWGCARLMPTAPSRGQAETSGGAR